MFDPHADPHGERTVRSQGAKSAADLILLEKKGRKALEYKDWKAPNQLVRSRSSSTGYTVDTVRQTIQKNFAAKGLSCVSNGEKCPL